MSEQSKAPALPWNIGPLPQECYDGDRFLCAVELHKDSGGGFSMSVVSVRCDEGYFALECEDEPWGWSGEDVTFWIKLEDRPSARDAELAALRRQVSELLAVIHADGGHYELKHGTAKAIADAAQIHYSRREQIDALKASRKAWEHAWHEDGQPSEPEAIKEARNADAACRAAGVELEDRT